MEGKNVTTHDQKVEEPSDGSRKPLQVYFTDGIGATDDDESQHLCHWTEKLAI